MPRRHAYLDGLLVDAIDADIRSQIERQGQNSLFGRFSPAAVYYAGNLSVKLSVALSTSSAR
jgi:hypothetical protein